MALGQLRRRIERFIKELFIFVAEPAAPSESVSTYRRLIPFKSTAQEQPHFPLLLLRKHGNDR